MRKRSRISVLQRISQNPRQLCVAECGHRADKRIAQRALAADADDALERVVPQREPPAAVDDAHSLIQRFDDFAAPVLGVEPGHVVAVNAKGAIHRHRRNRQQFPHAVVENLNHAHRNARSGEIDGRVDHDPRRPGSIDRLFRQERPCHLSRQHFDDDVGGKRSRERKDLHRPCEVAEGPAKRMMREAGCLRGGCHRHEVHQRAAELMRALGVRDAARDSTGDRDDQRRVRAEDQQRRELDDERRRHRRAVLGRRRLRRERGDQDPRQDQTAELDGAIRLEPAQIVEQQRRADRCRRDRGDVSQTSFHRGRQSNARTVLQRACNVFS